MVHGFIKIKNVITAGEKMPKIKVNTKIMPVNVISNLGTDLEIDQETLNRWNRALLEWWNVQLEMDKLIQNKSRNDL